MVLVSISLERAIESVPAALGGGQGRLCIRLYSLIASVAEPGNFAVMTGVGCMEPGARIHARSHAGSLTGCIRHANSLIMRVLSPPPSYMGAT